MRFRFPKPTMYKFFTSDVRTMSARLSSAQEEMKTLSEKLAADSVKLQSMMAEAQRLSMSAAYRVNELHPAMTAHVTLINTVAAQSKTIANMQTAMLQPVYLTDLEACMCVGDAGNCEAEIMESDGNAVEEEIIESVSRNVNEADIRVMIQRVFVDPEDLMARPTEIMEGTIAGVNSYCGGRSNAVELCTPCVVVKCMGDGKYVVCFYNRYDVDSLNYRIVTSDDIIGRPNYP
jgi:hypothetical protein